jgi:hypothetical protein
MRNKIDLYSRISIALVLAFLTSELLVQEVFLARSPNIRPDFSDRLVETSLAFVNIDNYRSLFQGNGFFRKDENSPRLIEENLASKPFIQTGIKGVYARETEKAKQTEIVYDEIDWVEIFYETKSGTMEKIKIPRGTEPPPPGLY